MRTNNIERYDNFLSSLRAPSSSTWSEAQESVSIFTDLEFDERLRFTLLGVARALHLHHCQPGEEDLRQTYRRLQLLAQCPKRQAYCRHPCCRSSP
jgi:hypothetical protein